MPEFGCWEIKKRVTFSSFEGEITLDDFDKMNKAQLALLGKGSPPVHVIIELGAKAASSLTIGQVKEASTFLKHPALGWLALVGGTPLTRFVMTAIIDTFGVNFHAAESKATALAFLSNLEEPHKIRVIDSPSHDV